MVVLPLPTHLAIHKPWNEFHSVCAPRGQGKLVAEHADPEHVSPIGGKQWSDPRGLEDSSGGCQRNEYVAVSHKVTMIHEWWWTPLQEGFGEAFETVAYLGQVSLRLKQPRASCSVNPGQSPSQQGLNEHIFISPWLLKVTCTSEIVLVNINC